MPYATAINAILKIDPNAVYQSCRYSLLHKIIQDATHSSINTWRYKRPEFHWSRGAIDKLVSLYDNTIAKDLPDQFNLVVDTAEARRLLHQEHIVPTGIVIRHLLDLPNPGYPEITEVLERANTVCIVTVEENSRLFKTRMPPNTNFMDDKWARYRFPRKGEPIRVSRYFCTWEGITMRFSCRPAGDLTGAP